ncbi:MAG: TFIIB-type zinc ribbon-containing protein [Clostridia bacterium]|nr:TFIIB-type zinc ribbon-containing protein [Clostridia bacterium]
MKIVQLTCPACGATLQTDDEHKTLTCEYCGNVLLVDKEIEQPSYDASEEAGYAFEKGRLRARAEQTDVYTPPRTRRTWLWVLGWIFIFPVPLTILMIRNKKLNLAVRIIVVVAAWLLYAFMYALGSEDQNDAAAGAAVNTAYSYSVTAELPVESL